MSEAVRSGRRAGTRAAEGSPRTSRFWRLRFLTVALPALLAGAFEFIRPWLERRFHLPAIAGNVITALLALVGGLIYFQTAYALAARLAEEARRAEAERQVLVARHAVADQLHDSIAQTLFFLNVRLKGALRRAHDLGSRDLEGMLGEAAAANETAYRQLRATIRQLAPEAAAGAEADAGAGAPLTARGLARLAERELAGSGVAVLGAEDGPEASLPPSAARVVEAILAEALRNVRKHAHAASVRVWLREADGQGRAGVADDGRGFRPEAARGYGLAAARRRAAAAGLRLRVQSAPGSGTEVEVAWPGAEGEAPR